MKSISKSDLKIVIENEVINAIERAKNNKSITESADSKGGDYTKKSFENSRLKEIIKEEVDKILIEAGWMQNIGNVAGKVAGKVVNAAQNFAQGASSGYQQASANAGIPPRPVVPGKIQAPPLATPNNTPAPAPAPPPLPNLPKKQQSQAPVKPTAPPIPKPGTPSAQTHDANQSQGTPVTPQQQQQIKSAIGQLKSQLKNVQNIKDPVVSQAVVSHILNTLGIQLPKS